jgi:hypothetical protein
MPLQGTFDVLGFADVLELLAQKETTGRLHVRSRSIGANVYLEEGRLVGADVGEHPNTSTLDVRSRLEEVCFELLEAERGSFEFVPDTTGMGPPTLSLQVDEVLESARKRLEEWREIQTVIPSLELHPSVIPVLGTDEVTLTRDRWRLLTAIDGRRSIRAIARMLVESDYEVCRNVKSLIEVGVVEIDSPTRALPAAQRERVFVDDGLMEVDEGTRAGGEGAGAIDAGGEGVVALGAATEAVNVTVQAGTDRAEEAGPDGADRAGTAGTDGATTDGPDGDATGAVEGAGAGGTVADPPTDPPVDADADADVAVSRTATRSTPSADADGTDPSDGETPAVPAHDGNADLTGASGRPENVEQEREAAPGSGSPGAEPSSSAGPAGPDAQAGESKAHRAGIIRIGRRSRPGRDDS